jgi:hypothetical protein
MISIRFSFFLLYRNCKRLPEFEETEISRQSCEKQGGKFLRLSPGFCPRIRPLVSRLLWVRGVRLIYGPEYCNAAQLSAHDSCQRMTAVSG